VQFVSIVGKSAFAQSVTRLIENHVASIVGKGVARDKERVTAASRRTMQFG
jgi:ABC-type dipeptide/oligopeptide/nickel transport system ATPase component